MELIVFYVCRLSVLIPNLLAQLRVSLLRHLNGLVNLSTRIMLPQTSHEGKKFLKMRPGIYLELHPTAKSFQKSVGLAVSVDLGEVKERPIRRNEMASETVSRLPFCQLTTYLRSRMTLL